jgi:hypothetical protein
VFVVTSSRVDVRVLWRRRVMQPDSGLSARARLTAAALAEFLNGETGECSPALTTVASFMGQEDWRGARDGVAELERAGFLRVERRTGSSSIYRVPLPLRADVGVPLHADAGAGVEADVEPLRAPLHADVGDPCIGMQTNQTVTRESEQQQAAARGDAAHRDGRTPAQQLVAFYVDESRRHGVEPLPRVVGHVAREVARVLELGREPELVRAALAIVVDKALHPSTLQSAVQQAQRAGATRGGVDPEYAHLSW